MLLLLFLLLALPVAADSQQAPNTAQHARKTTNVIFVMTDGLRWQEVFRGADSSLLDREHGGVTDPRRAKASYWRDDLNERRALLMPFLWKTIAGHGQLYGNRDAGSDAFVTNGLNFSYPGYNETLCGFPDPRIHSNDKIPNPNATVLEWLAQKPPFHGRVAAFAAWDTFPFILNAERAGFPVNAGFDAFHPAWHSPALELLNHLRTDLPVLWSEEPVDAVPFHTAMEYLKQRKPRVLFLSLGETDEWAHSGNYDQYLDAAHRADAYLKSLWDAVQSTPGYRDHTTLIFSPDHGRGSGLSEWKNHGEKIPESKYIWMAFLGPDTPPLAERRQIAAVTQIQIAATLAALLGEDYTQAVSRAGPPVADVLPRNAQPSPHKY